MFLIHCITPGSVIHTFGNQEWVRGGGSAEKLWLSQVSSASSLPGPMSSSIWQGWEFTQLPVMRAPGNRLCRRLRWSLGLWMLCLHQWRVLKKLNNTTLATSSPVEVPLRSGHVAELSGSENGTKAWMLDYVLCVVISMHLNFLRTRWVLVETNKIKKWYYTWTKRGIVWEDSPVSTCKLHSFLKFTLSLHTYFFS